MVKMLTESLMIMLAKSLLNILAELLCLKASMNIYLIRYIQHDEGSIITLEYFLRYSFSVVDLKTSNWVDHFVVQV